MKQKMAIRFDSRRYEISHFAKPRGYGYWIFQIDDPIASGKIDFSATGTLRAAKEEVSKYIRQMFEANVSPDEMPEKIQATIMP